MIVRERIGLLRSDLNVGPGDDIVKINGAVVASTIDLGEGNNILILEGAVDQDSRILAGSGNNRIQINGGLGSDIIGGSGDDVFTLSSLQLAGLVDGGGGNDLLVTGAGDQRDLAVIQGPDQGFLRGLRFASIEGLDLGGGDDVALLGLDGTLSGQLLGGNGLDRLQFTNWELPVTVDLDLGSATAIYGGARGGISGFEQVYGGIGNDVLAASGFFSGLDGNDGDDILYLRWTPWLSQPGRRLELEGGGGSDLVVIVGLEQPIPLGWDGVSGIPVLTDLHLNRFNNDKTDTDSVGWLRQVVGQDGTVSQTFIRLTPSSVEGLGDVKLLPIAPLEQLLSGMADGTKQLAIALDPSQPMAAGELHLLGSQGQGTSRLIAYVPSDVLIPQLGSSPVL
jgi:hypothetical protein